MSANPLYTTLRPGLLVGLSTSIKGNVSYDKSETKERRLSNGAIVEEWETEKTIKDAAEMARAVEVRAKARSLVGAVCSATAFGYLCPEDDRPILDKAFSDAVALCAEFNRTARVTRIKFAAITGRIAADDVSAIRAINNEVRGLLADLEDGVKGLSVEAIRDAAKRATQLGNMLAPDAQARLSDALKAARSVASKLVKAGETAAIEVDATVLEKLATARTAFLDLDGATEVAAPDDGSGRAIDLAPHDGTTAETSSVPPRDIELDDMLS